MPRYVSITVALSLVVAVACVPLLTVAKWIGHFTLTVDLELGPEIDSSSITYTEAWNRDVATWLCNEESEFNAGFEPPTMTAPGSHSITITCTGDYGAYGLLDTYRQPEFLVVQYCTIDGPNDRFARKDFAIPTGRGPRRTTLTLP